MSCGGRGREPMTAVDLPVAAVVTALDALAGVLLGRVVVKGRRRASFYPRYAAAAACSGPLARRRAAAVVPAAVAAAANAVMAAAASKFYTTLSLHAGWLRRVRAALDPVVARLTAATRDGSGGASLTGGPPVEGSASR